MNTSDARFLAHRFCGARAIKLSTLGNLAVGNARLFEGLDAGRVTVRTLRRLIQYLSNNWPEGLEWPSDIPRPEPTAQEARERVLAGEGA